MISRIRNWTSKGIVWPPIDFELNEYREKGLLNGLVLNAGAGWRDISDLVTGTLVNQDLTWPEDNRTNIDIFSPLHQIPREDNTFDTILCIAVLEHVENPEEVVPELYRVLKPGGNLIASVPFLQPEHKVPTDYQRYTKDGLIRLFSHHGFTVIETKPLFSVYHTIHWIVYEWLHLKNSILYKALRVLILPALAWLARRSRLQSDVLASVFQIHATKS